MGYERTAQSEYQLIWVRARRNAWIQAQGGKCAACGSTKALEVDHIDRSTKEIRSTNIWSRKLEVREAELAKCQVLCQTCHLVKTRSEAPRDESHGRTTTYRKGCRCTECRAAHTEAARKTRGSSSWTLV